MVLRDDTVWARDEYHPYLLHQVIVSNTGRKWTDNDKNDPDYSVSQFSTEMKLQAEKLINEDGQEFSVAVPAYGERVVAFTMTDKEREKLDENAEFSISSESGVELVLFKTYSSNVTMQKGTDISTPEFCKSLLNKYRYLVLIVNSTNTAKTAKLEATLGGSEFSTFDELVGYYTDGRVTLTEIDLEGGILSFLEDIGACPQKLA